MPKKVVEITVNEFAKKGAEQTIIDMILQTAVKVHAQATTLVPVDLGQLRNSLQWETVKNNGGANSNSGESAPEGFSRLKADESKGHVGTNLEYGKYQEFGTSKQQAQPYLRPAVEAVKGANASQLAKKYGREAMEKAFKQKKVRMTSE